MNDPQWPKPVTHRQQLWLDVVVKGEAKTVLVELQIRERGLAEELVTPTAIQTHGKVRALGGNVIVQVLRTTRPQDEP